MYIKFGNFMAFNPDGTSYTTRIVSLSFDPKTGVTTARLSSETGTRIGREIKSKEKEE